MKRITRARRLTAQEAEKARTIRAQVARDFPCCTKPTPFAEFCAAVDGVGHAQRKLDMAAQLGESDLEPLREAARLARVEVKRMYRVALAAVIHRD